jgi:SPOR domain
MTKFFFWIFLIANGALFAFHQGYLAPLFSEGKEVPHSAVLNPDKVRLIPASAASMASVSSADTVVVAACTEIGNFSLTKAKQFEMKLAPLALGANVSRRNTQEVFGHMVFIPSQASKEGADRKAGELHRRGINDFYIIQDHSGLQWGISLGVFKTAAAAQAHLADLNQKGVRSARIMVRNTWSDKVIFQLRNLNLHAKNTLDKIKNEFPNQEIRNCV